MLRLIISRYTGKLIVFLVLIFTAGCFSQKTIPTNNINELKFQRKFIKVHAEDSLWIITGFQIRDKILSGKIIRTRGSESVLKTVDIYAAPFEAVRIEGDILNVSTDNIGKADYRVPDAWMIVSTCSILFVLALFSIPL
jgi:hypothetical protein